MVKSVSTRLRGTLIQSREKTPNQKSEKLIGFSQ